MLMAGNGCCFQFVIIFFGRVVVVIVVVFVWGWLAAKYMHINMFCCATLHPGV